MTAASESSPLLQGDDLHRPPGEGHAQPPPSLVRPGADPRPKPARSVTFDPNPVSRTIDLSPVPSPPTHEAQVPYVYGRHRVPSGSSAAVAASESTPTSYGSIPSMPSAKVALARRSGHAGGTSASPPVLTAINNRLRRRNSSGSVPASSRQQLQQLQQAAAAPKIGPQRTSKNAQKLKLLPNPEFGDEGPDEESGRDVYSQYTRIKDPTARRDAAFLGKADRGRLPRVTAYCTANRYQMDGLMHFLKGRSKTRGSNPKLIDECVYTPYNYNYNKHVNTESNGNGNDSNGHYYGNHFHTPSGQQQQQAQDRQRDLMAEQEWAPDRENRPATAPEPGMRERRHSAGELDLDRNDLIDLERGDAGNGMADQDSRQPVDEGAFVMEEEAVASPQSGGDGRVDPFYSEPQPSAPDELVAEYEDNSGERVVDLNIHVRTPEVFLFDYGVVVIWGMSEAQEQRFLKELARFETEKLAPDDVEAEFFNFYYTREYQARIYNDFIALRDDRSGSYMAKLAISHALAQSVKTSLFEELIASTIDTCKDIPTQIALTGTIALSRSQINMQIGELFILRINIHLNGSVLDTPELFWVEPQLEPMYQAVRSYLEMDQRVSLLTQRLDVIADLLAVLKEQLSHGHGEKLEWIVIILIAAEILVAAINIVVDIYAGD